MTRWRAWLSSGPASTPPCRGLLHFAFRLERSPAPGGQLLGQMCSSCSRSLSAFGPAVRNRTSRSLSAACRASIAALDAELGPVRSACPPRPHPLPRPAGSDPAPGTSAETPRSAGRPAARDPVLALDRTDSSNARRSAEGSPPPAARDAFRQHRRAPAPRTESPAAARIGRSARSRIEHELEPEERSGPGRRVGLQRPSLSYDPPLGVQCNPRPFNLHPPPGTARATAASNCPFRSHRSIRSCPRRSSARLPVAGQHARHPSLLPGPLPAGPARNAYRSRTGERPARAWPSCPPPGAPAREAGGAGGSPLSLESGFTRRTLSSPSAGPRGGARPRRDPCRARPRRTSDATCSTGASGSDAQPERTQVGGEILVAVEPSDLLDQIDLADAGRDASRARPPRSGRRPAWRRPWRRWRPGISRPRARALRRPAPGSRARDGGRYAADCDGPGQRSSGASASRPPPVAAPMISMQRRNASAPPQRSMPRSNR